MAIESKRDAVSQKGNRGKPATVETNPSTVCEAEGAATRARQQRADRKHVDTGVLCASHGHSIRLSSLKDRMSLPF